MKRPSVEQLRLEVMHRTASALGGAGLRRYLQDQLHADSVPSEGHAVTAPASVDRPDVQSAIGHWPSAGHAARGEPGAIEEPAQRVGAPAAPLCGTAPTTGAKPSMTRGMNANWNRVEDRALVVCQRLRQARTYNGLTLEEASALLGCEDKEQLSLIENGERLPPLWLVDRAQQLYAVPMDYLWGNIGDEEAERHDVYAAIFTELVQASLAENATRICDHLETLTRDGLREIGVLRNLLPKIGTFLRAFERFRVRNPDFEEMPAGAMLLSGVQELTNSHRIGEAAVFRFDHALPRAVATEAARLAPAGRA
jgi:transcriptional regulator with XRE-family HTH domain